MPRAEIGHYIHVYDQSGNYEYEGIFIEETSGIVRARGYGNMSVLITKVLKEARPGAIKIGDLHTFPMPRYVPVFIRELTENEKLLYVQ